MLISFDTETTGTDHFHGAKPFFVTTCDGESPPTYWQWEVDPVTRQPLVPDSDLDQIVALLEEADEIVLQNAKFDVQAMNTVLPGILYEWPWHKTLDTLLAGHLLASNRPHDLTSMGIQYLGVDIEKYEKKLEDIVQHARRLARSHLPEWRIATEGLGEMPSAKEKNWKYDTWLPAAFVALRPDLIPTNPGEPIEDTRQRWASVLADYSNVDSEVTIHLWLEQKAEIERRKLWPIYQERLKVLRIAYDMEQRGVTISRQRLDELTIRYEEETREAGARCVNIAASLGHELTLPKSGNNKSLLSCCFDVLQLPVLEHTEKGAASLNKSVLEEYAITLPANSKQLLFVKSLMGKRKKDTALSYMAGYRRFWLPLEVGEGWYVLHPSLNPTGTDTLRWSSSNPNAQNIAKQEVECPRCKGDGCATCKGSGKALRSQRYCFGPGPGREWWSLDAKNIELRLPAYEAQEEEMIALFESADKPPYYGSNHLLNFSTIYPDIWDAELREVGIEKVGPHCKRKYASSWYQWCKNGDFAVQYGAMDRADGLGTADRAFHRKGCHALLKARFSKMDKLNQWCIAFAEKHGYIETIPDRTVDPKRGYPVLCTRTEWGKILPTVPLNYRIQSSAMWWTMKAMIRVEARLAKWKVEDGFDGFITMQVHDELVLDFPRGSDQRANLWRIKIIQRLMEEGGEDFGIPTPVGCEYHPSNWAEGISV